MRTRIQFPRGFKSFSAEETKKYAGSFARLILRRRRGLGALVVALEGELGAGKTTFAQGFVRGLGLRQKINSPTFVFVKRFKIKVGRLRSRTTASHGRLRSRTTAGQGRLRSRTTASHGRLRSRTTASQGGFNNFFHVDAYRIKKTEDLKVFRLEEIFEDKGNMVLVEWASNIRKILPKSTIWVKMRHGRGENEREIGISNFQ